MLHFLHILVQCNCRRKSRPNLVINMKNEKKVGVNEPYNTSRSGWFVKCIKHRKLTNKYNNSSKIPNGSKFEI